MDLIENMFGDMLTDEASMLAGSVGLPLRHSAKDSAGGQARCAHAPHSRDPRFLRPSAAPRRYCRPGKSRKLGVSPPRSRSACFPNSANSR